jgi:hypothetical protein
MIATITKINIVIFCLAILSAIVPAMFVLGIMFKSEKLS